MEALFSVRRASNMYSTGKCWYLSKISETERKTAFQGWKYLVRSFSDTLHLPSKHRGQH